LGLWGLSQSYLVAKSLSKSEALNPWQIFWHPMKLIRKVIMAFNYSDISAYTEKSSGDLQRIRRYPHTNPELKKDGI